MLSLDFELHWGIHDKRSVADYRQNLTAVRSVVPRLLDVFAEHRLHATWATVGFLFCDGVDELHSFAPALRPRYERPERSPYRLLPQLGSSEATDPDHFAPTLLAQIRETPGQEIASHTFSHYYALEPGADLASFRADLQAARRVAQAKGIELESLVFPRNQYSPAHLAVAAEEGFLAFRGQPSHWMYRPRSEDSESRARRAARLIDAYVPISGSHSARVGPGAPRDVPASRFLRPYSARLARVEGLREQRVLRGMSRAARSGQSFHLWWHPHNFGRHTEANFALLGRIASHFDVLRDRYGLRSLTMAEAARELVP